MKPQILGLVTLLLLSGIPAAHADDFRCTGAVGASTVDNLIVPDGKQGGSASILSVTIDGDLQFEENRGALNATANDVEGNLQAWKNRGGLTLTNNLIRENLQCKENNPAPTGGGNQAGDKEDQCASL
ncbi:hypothetical protein [Thermostichus vulcanus]|uniref:Uncharacterized protein n=1 Tax=Thermostichus vulcanus str. 'Rupite' TaxID=2813851 RepID=A0ABT0CA39_THEVL|nr:hypothetical protein [Thermostichus vulcanus]MCJ2542646.1 hypothetical protein [Thermostichus vulcanus str. 'Rupite']